ncbi:hypothetical protein C8J56DRAFT_889413 [Mycena floridula]|nr:hypothetical protein C8J56DRAFT_889413 [Mycena floridula]
MQDFTITANLVLLAVACLPNDWAPVGNILLVPMSIQKTTVGPFPLFPSSFAVTVFLKPAALSGMVPRLNDFPSQNYQFHCSLELVSMTFALLNVPSAQNFAQKPNFPFKMREETMQQATAENVMEHILVLYLVAGTCL